jgi:hypothetical protein
MIASPIQVKTSAPLFIIEVIGLVDKKPIEKAV